jgi:hypothetical protein
VPVTLLKHSSRWAMILGVAALVASCSKQSEAPPAASPDYEAASEAPAVGVSEPSPAIPWAEQTREQRLEYMGNVVYPKMKALFQGYDAEAFADFKCKHCHGDDMEQVDFKMPNGLVPFPKDDVWQAAVAQDEDAAKFMAEQVVPAMAELLGQAPYDPETHQGFGCLNCHQGD